MSDLVNNPSHYKGKSGFQPWDVVEEFDLGYNDGTAVVYILRAGRKPGQPYIQDLQKAIKHLEKEIENHLIRDRNNVSKNV